MSLLQPVADSSASLARAAEIVAPWTEQSAARLGLAAHRTADGGPASQAVP